MIALLWHNIVNRCPVRIRRETRQHRSATEDGMIGIIIYLAWTYIAITDPMLAWNIMVSYPFVIVPLVCLYDHTRRVA